MVSEVLTVEQVAEFLRLHVMTVYRLAKDGKLPGFKVGSRWRFQRDVLEAWMLDQALDRRSEGEGRSPRRGGVVHASHLGKVEENRWARKRY